MPSLMLKKTKRGPPPSNDAAKDKKQQQKVLGIKGPSEEQLRLEELVFGKVTSVIAPKGKLVCIYV